MVLFAAVGVSELNEIGWRRIFDEEDEAPGHGLGVFGNRSWAKESGAQPSADHETSGLTRPKSSANSFAYTVAVDPRRAARGVASFPMGESQSPFDARACERDSGDPLVTKTTVIVGNEGKEEVHQWIEETPYETIDDLIVGASIMVVEDRETHILAGRRHLRGEPAAELRVALVASGKKRRITRITVDMTMGEELPDVAHAIMREMIGCCPSTSARTVASIGRMLFGMCDIGSLSLRQRKLCICLSIFLTETMKDMQRRDFRDKSSTVVFGPCRREDFLEARETTRQRRYALTEEEDPLNQETMEGAWHHFTRRGTTTKGTRAARPGSRAQGSFLLACHSMWLTEIMSLGATARKWNSASSASPDCFSTVGHHDDRMVTLWTNVGWTKVFADVEMTRVQIDDIAGKPVVMRIEMAEEKERCEESVCDKVGGAIGRVLSMVVRAIVAVALWTGYIQLVEESED